jgi:hypothetical protein
MARIVWLAEFSKWLREHSCRITHGDRYQLYQSVLERTDRRGGLDYWEFGVQRGDSLRWWVDNVPDANAAFHGFDVFTGLPEDWGEVPRGTFDCQGQIPAIDDARVHFQVGLFQDTLPDFVAAYGQRPERTRIVHLDADLYSSTLFVLTSLAPLLRPGDVLVFDEFGSVRNPMYEFRAFHDFCSAYKPQYRVLGATDIYEQVALEIA